MKRIQAGYQEGIFRPLGKVELPDQTEVEFEPKIVGKVAPKYGRMEAIVEVMSEEFETGESDLVARHYQHQP